MRLIIFCLTLPGSKWIADWLTGTVEQYPGAFPASSVLRIDQALAAYSDHASFWENGYDAVITIEHVNAGNRNPVYHTLADTLENVAPSQLALVARLIAGSLARLADPGSQINLAVFPEDLVFDMDDLETGRSAPFFVDVHAFGPSGGGRDDPGVGRRTGRGGPPLAGVGVAAGRRRRGDQRTSFSGGSRRATSASTRSPS